MTGDVIFNYSRTPPTPALVTSHSKKVMCFSVSVSAKIKLNFPFCINRSTVYEIIQNEIIRDRMGL